MAHSQQTTWHQQRLAPSASAGDGSQAPSTMSGASMLVHGSGHYQNVVHGRPAAGVGLVPPPQPQPQPVHAHQPVAGMPVFTNKARKLSDRVLHPNIKSLVPESQAYMDLLDFENKLDTTIRRKQFDIHEALKRPLKQVKKLRVFVTSTYSPPARSDPGGGGGDTIPTVGSWELRIEGRLVEELQPQQSRNVSGDDGASSQNEENRMQSSPSPAPGVSSQPSAASSSSPKRKFSTYFRSLVIELDRDLYGPDHHLVEWHRLPNTAETDGFQVKRVGDHDIRCTMLFMLNYDPPRYRLDKSLARRLGIHTANRPTVVQYLWEYIKEHKLQTIDEHGHSVICWDPQMFKLFPNIDEKNPQGRPQMKFADIPKALDTLLFPPDPVVISHIIPCNPHEPKKVVCYDIEVELDDPLREKYQQFMLSSQIQEDLAQLDQKLFDTVDAINQLRANRDFLLQFSNDPQQFIHKWLLSQANDLRKISDASGNPEEERLAEYYQQDWGTEAVSRYIYNKTMEKKAELEQTLGMLRTVAPAAAAGHANQPNASRASYADVSEGVVPHATSSQPQQLPSAPPPPPLPSQTNNVAVILQPPPLASSSNHFASGGGSKPPAISSSAAAAASSSSQM